MRADNPAARAVRSTGCMSSSVRPATRLAAKKALMRLKSSTTSTRMRPIARTTVRDDCAAVSDEDSATSSECVRLQGSTHTPHYDVDRGEWAGGTTATVVGAVGGRCATALELRRCTVEDSPAFNLLVPVHGRSLAAEEARAR